MNFKLQITHLQFMLKGVSIEGQKFYFMTFKVTIPAIFGHETTRKKVMGQKFG